MFNHPIVLNNLLKQFAKTPVLMKSQSKGTYQLYVLGFKALSSATVLDRHADLIDEMHAFST